MPNVEKFLNFLACSGNFAELKNFINAVGLDLLGSLGGSLLGSLGGSLLGSLQKYNDPEVFIFLNLRMTASCV